ncbi:MAG: N-acetyl-gamma-glutamyl-phosphate reductase [Ruminococcaceae bacterium]|nr:N-acetyl-gamma-glutamyl-phosphate reductase [Oscillospiraceae bacterium]
MINVGILGATGYAGIETVRLLANHPNVKITRLISHSFEGKKISEIYPSLEGVLDIECVSLDVDDIAKNCDLVFTALPHGVSKDVIPGLYEKGLKIIDLSGDFRYNDVKVYEKWYGESHPSPELLEKSVYGLCELYREKIRNTSLIGNPGCYTTCSILALYPLLKASVIETKNIIIDAKSGVSGAGRTTKLDYSFCECTENMLAYKIATHRHTSEIEQELSIAAGSEVMVSFTPHLIPLKRGIYATCYANLSNNVTGDEIEKIYKDFYENEHFIRIMSPGKIPESNWVAGSNFANIGFQIDERLGRIVVCSTIDNLIKGAAGQAVQNMNIMMGFDEKAGLDMPAMYL